MELSLIITSCIAFYLICFLCGLAVYSIVRPKISFLIGECILVGSLVLTSSTFIITFFFSTKLTTSGCIVSLFAILTVIYYRKLLSINLFILKKLFLFGCFLLFLVFTFYPYGFLSVLTFTGPTHSDEFHQWNFYPKILFYSNDVIRESILGGPYVNYPPYSALLAAGHSWIHGKFIEGSPRIVSFSIFLFSLLTFYELLVNRYKSLTLGLFGTTSLFLLLQILPIDTYLGSKNFFYRSYQDGPTALLLGLAFIRIFDIIGFNGPTWRRYIYASFWLISAVFTKPMSVVFIPSLILFILLNEILTLSRVSLIRKFFFIFLLFSIPIFIKLLFNHYLTYVSTPITPLFKSREILYIISVNGFTILKQIFHRLTEPQYYILYYLFLFSIAIAFLTSYSLLKHSFNITSIVGPIMLLLSLAFTPIYLWICYSLLFSEYESGNLASFDRYFSWGIIHFSIGLTFIVLDFLHRNLKNLPSLLLASLYSTFFIVTFFALKPYAKPNMSDLYYKEHTRHLITAINQLKSEKIISENVSLLCVDGEREITYLTNTQYLLYPIRVIRDDSPRFRKLVTRSEVETTIRNFMISQVLVVRCSEATQKIFPILNTTNRFIYFLKYHNGGVTEIYQWSPNSNPGGKN